MKRLLLLSIACLATCLVAKAQIVDPRLPDGGSFDDVADVFHQKMVGVMVREGYKVNELSKNAIVTFTIDTLGQCVNPEFPLSYGGETYFPTERSKELVIATLAEMGTFYPAVLERRKIFYNVTLLVDFTLLPGAVVSPSYKGNGKKSMQVLYDYVVGRIQLHEGMLHKEYEVLVEFFVERDGSVTIGKVLESTDPTLERQVQRVILKTSGKWTPGYMMGIPIRVSYVFPLRLKPQGPPPETFDDIKRY